MAVITEPGAGDKEVTDMFTFWRPSPQNSRKSAILHMTDKQLDVMYALAGEGVHVHCASLALYRGHMQGFPRTQVLAMAGKFSLSHGVAAHAMRLMRQCLWISGYPRRCHERASAIVLSFVPLPLCCL